MQKKPQNCLRAVFSYWQKVFFLKIINCRQGGDLALAASAPSVSFFFFFLFLDGRKKTQSPGNNFPTDQTSSNLGFKQVGVVLLKSPFEHTACQAESRWLSKPWRNICCTFQRRVQVSSRSSFYAHPVDLSTWRLCPLTALPELHRSWEKVISWRIGPWVCPYYKHIFCLLHQELYLVALSMVVCLFPLCFHAGNGYLPWLNNIFI